MKKTPVPMEPGFRRVGAASCRVNIPKVVPAHMKNRMREITEVKTAPDKRGQGYATTLMHKICHEADQMGFVLMLTATAEPGENEEHLEQANLEGWYTTRFGFQMIQENIKLMARMPGATPRVGLKLHPIVVGVLEQARHG